MSQDPNRPMDIEICRNVIKTGATDYVTKPFDTRELLARISVQILKAESTKEASSLSLAIWKWI